MQIDFETMVERVMRLTDPEPTPTVVGYAYAGWEEDAKRREELFKQSKELRNVDTTRLVAEMCRRLMIEEEVDYDNFVMLALASQIRGGDADAIERKNAQVAKVSVQLAAERKRWR